MPWTKEDAAAYRQTPAGQKSRRISNWKSRGIICDDWDALHERYMNTSHCEKCDVLLTTGLGRTGKCLDHDHTIKDRENVRAVLCNACNVNDRCTNTSGIPNVSYDKCQKRWKYQKIVDGVPHQKTFKTKEAAIRYKYEYEDQTVDIT